MRFVKQISLAIALATVAGGVSTVAFSKSNAQVEEASYVRICTNTRGQRDRRACHGKEDPKRTVLALNLPAEFAR